MLLRASVEFFSSWGMELLVTQLHDHSKAVSMEALDILDEACEDKVSTHYKTTAFCLVIGRNNKRFRDQIILFLLFS